MSIARPSPLRPFEFAFAFVLASATTVGLALASIGCHEKPRADAEGPAPKAKKPSSKSTEPTSATPVVPAETSAPSPSSVARTVAPGAWPPPNPGRAVLVASNASAVKERWLAEIGGWGKAVAVSGVHERVVATSGHDLVLLDARTGAKLVTRAPPCDDVLDLGFGPASLVVACAHAIEEVDPKTLEKRASTSTRGAAAHAAAVAWPGVAMSHKDGVLARYALGGAAPPEEIAIAGPPVPARSIALSRDGRRVAVGFEQGTVWAWEWARPATPIKLAQYEVRAAVAFSPSGALVVESGPSFALGVWRFDKGGATSAGSLRTDESWANGLAIDDAGSLAIAGSSGGYLLLAGDSRRVLDKAHDSIESLAVDEWFTSFVGIDRSGRVRLFATDPAPAAPRASP